MSLFSCAADSTVLFNVGFFSGLLVYTDKFYHLTEEVWKWTTELGCLRNGTMGLADRERNVLGCHSSDPESQC